MAHLHLPHNTSTGPAFDPKDKKQLKQLKHIFAKLDGMDGRPEQEYMTTVTTPTRSHLRNKTLMSAGLHGVGGLATAVLERADGTKLSGTDINPSVRVQVQCCFNILTMIPCTPSITIHHHAPQANDKYIVTGSLEGIKQLRRTAGLVSTEQHLIDKSKVNILHRRLIQAVVADHPSLVGQTARTVDFQKTYGGVLLAIGTHGLPRIGAKLEDIRFQPGDVLLIDAVPGFTEKHSTDRSFHLLREVPKSSPLKSNRMWFALALVVILVGLQIFTGASGIATLDLFPGVGTGMRCFCVPYILVYQVLQFLCLTRFGVGCWYHDCHPLHEWARCSTFHQLGGVHLVCVNEGSLGVPPHHEAHTHKHTFLSHPISTVLHFHLQCRGPLKRPMLPAPLLVGFKTSPRLLGARVLHLCQCTLQPGCFPRLSPTTPPPR